MTLIEAVLFISIALGLIVGGIVFYQQASFAARYQDQVRVLSAIVSEVRAAYQNEDNLGALIDFSNNLSSNDFATIGENAAAVLAAAGAVPASIVAPAAGPLTGSPLRTEWDGELGVRVGRGTDGLASVDLLLVDLPVEACLRLAATDSQGTGDVSDGMIQAISFGTVRGTGGDMNFQVPSRPIGTLSNVDFCTDSAGGSGAVALGLRITLF